MIYSVLEWKLSIVYSCRKRSTENNLIITISATIYLVNLQINQTGAALYGAFVLYLLLNMSYMWLNAIYNPLLLKDSSSNAVFWVGFGSLAFLFFPVAVRQHSIIPEIPACQQHLGQVLPHSIHFSRKIWELCSHLPLGGRH